MKNKLFIHNVSTAQTLNKLSAVDNHIFIQYLSTTYKKVIRSAFCLYKSVLGTFARFPHSLLLLLLFININIIYKTSLRMEYK